MQTITAGTPLPLPTSGITVTIPAAMKFYAYCSNGNSGDCLLDIKFSATG